jgi:hypothetical protein
MALVKYSLLCRSEMLFKTEKPAWYCEIPAGFIFRDTTVVNGRDTARQGADGYVYPRVERQRATFSISSEGS